VSALAPTNVTWAREIYPDDMFLFRYSALTFNSHRIHYDRRYATQVEGYPGLVVYGPLIATLLLDLLRRYMPDAKVETFTFKAMKPIFDIAPFKVCAHKEDAKTVNLWAVTPEGQIGMNANVTLA
jgi:3-methylfumaryl-CoA hydratase